MLQSISPVQYSSSVNSDSPIVVCMQCKATEYLKLRSGNKFYLAMYEALLLATKDYQDF